MPSGVYKRTKEHRQKISEARKGMKHSKETKQKIGKANSVSLKGRKPTKETKRKMSKSHKVKKIKKICKFCGNKFKVIPSRSKSKFCSYKCFNNYRKHIRVERKCKECGITFLVPNYKDKVFCSKSCANKGKNNPFYGKKHTNKIRQKMSSSHKRKNLSDKTIYKMKNNDVNHHIYLKENSDEIIKMKKGNHTKIHWKAYNYLYYKYGKKAINKYFKWLNKNFNVKLNRKSGYKHHKYLRENSKEIIYLKDMSEHNLVHTKAYNYLYEAYGKEGIDDYIKWFNRILNRR